MSEKLSDLLNKKFIVPEMKIKRFKEEPVKVYTFKKYNFNKKKSTKDKK